MHILPLLLAFQTAHASHVVVWTRPDLPSARDQERVAKDLGPVEHLSGTDLAFPPSPWGPLDDAALDALASQVASARTRWTEFDVERCIVQDIESALRAVTALRDEGDRDAVIQALLLQGSALHWMDAPAFFALDTSVSEFQYAIGTEKVNRPWTDALAMAPDRAWARQDFPDAGSFEAFSALQATLDGLGAGSLRLGDKAEEASDTGSRIRATLKAGKGGGDLPPGTVLVIDGKAGTESPSLRPGRHFAHLQQEGAIRGRSRVEVPAVAEALLSGQVSGADIKAARDATRRNRLDQVPVAVVEALRDGPGQPEGVACVLAADEPLGPPMLLALGNEHMPEVHTAFLLSADLGLGLTGSPSLIMDNPKSNMTTDRSIGIQVASSWYNAAFTAKATLHDLPAAVIAIGDPATETNKDTRFMFQALAGPGLYLPRPRHGKVHALLTVQYGISMPGYLGRDIGLTLGLPASSNQWFRGGLHVWRARPLEGWPTGNMTSVGLRVGFGQGL